jgi:hypothetical protein
MGIGDPGAPQVGRIEPYSTARRPGGNLYVGADIGEGQRNGGLPIYDRVLATQDQFAWGRGAGG